MADNYSDIDIGIGIEAGQQSMAKKVICGLMLYFKLTTGPSSPPQAEAAAPAVAVAVAQHPIIGIMRNEELGKATLTYCVAIMLSCLTSSAKAKIAPPEMKTLLVTLSVACVSIWNGILLRESFPKTSKLIEQLGIALVFISFNLLIAVLLPLELRWVPTVCVAFVLLPFIVATLAQLN